MQQDSCGGRTSYDAAYKRLATANLGTFADQPAFFFASLSHVSTTVSGFSDIDSIP